MLSMRTCKRARVHDCSGRTCASGPHAQAWECSRGSARGWAAGLRGFLPAFLCLCTRLWECMWVCPCVFPWHTSCVHMCGLAQVGVIVHVCLRRCMHGCVRAGVRVWCVRACACAQLRMCLSVSVWVGAAVLPTHTARWPVQSLSACARVCLYTWLAFTCLTACHLHACIRPGLPACLPAGLLWLIACVLGTRVAAGVRATDRPGKLGGWALACVRAYARPRECTRLWLFLCVCVWASTFMCAMCDCVWVSESECLCVCVCVCV